jgi:putative transposase
MVRWQALTYIHGATIDACRMSNYRRAWIPGGSYFFTLVLADRRRRLLVDEAKLLRAALLAACRAQPFRVDAIVLLPDHLHMVCTLPAGDADYSTRIARLKAGFSRGLVGNEYIAASRLRRRERGIWQRRYWEHALRDETDRRAHIDYVHYNPVKHGHVDRVSQWRWSSFHRYVARGDLPPDWSDTPPDMAPGGEP